MEDEILDWKKLKTNSEKIGHREGIAEGRLTNIQHSFDDGYKSGFKNGFELGKLKGKLRHNSSSILEHTKQGNCLVCMDNSLLEKSPEEIDNAQWQSTQSILNKLRPS